MASFFVLKTNVGSIVTKHVNKRGNEESGLLGPTVLSLQLSCKPRILQILKVYFNYY